MSYVSNEKLPERIRRNLPVRAQTIFRKSFNNAEKQYKNLNKRRGKATLEEVSNKIAWSAIKKKYKKFNDKWVIKTIF
ncbi:ChaB family protein [Candidatus Pacearchaeota archaeon]|nr:ChaB family protein [Candidatus Pacearchaeota archaeon]